MTCFCTNVSSRHIWLAPFAFFYFGFFFRQGSGSWLLYSSKLLIQTRDGVMKLVPFTFSLNDTHLSAWWFVMLCYWHFPYQPLAKLLVPPKFGNLVSETMLMSSHGLKNYGTEAHANRWLDWYASVTDWHTGTQYVLAYWHVLILD